MLKVKFWRIENVVLMKILEQGDEIKRGNGNFFSDGDITLSSKTFPEMCDSTLYVCGDRQTSDNGIEIKEYGTIENAKTALSKYIHAISEYNRSLTETANPESDDDSETIIAE